MQDASVGKFVVAGSTTQTFFSAGGEVVCGSRGYLDCGLFSLHDQSLLARANAAPALRTIDLESLGHQRLSGVSLMEVDGVVGGPRTATVVGIDQFGIDDYSDLVLMADAPGLVQGDSGMMWLTQDGRAAAIHCRGEMMPPTSRQGSILLTAMSARRATEILNIKLRRA
jgi:hypothetical protein